MFQSDHLGGRHLGSIQKTMQSVEKTNNEPEPEPTEGAVSWTQHVDCPLGFGQDPESHNARLKIIWL